MVDHQEESESLSARPGRRRTSSIVLAVILGGTVALLVILVVAMFLLRQPLPSLTREDLSTAMDRWSVNEPANYDIQIQVQGRQPATYRVEVRDGEAILAERDGAPLKGHRTLGTWSVPGMFHTIEIDMATVEMAMDPSRPPLLLGAAFNATYGYPDRYHRSEVGTQMDVVWKVTAFVVLE